MKKLEKKKDVYNNIEYNLDDLSRDINEIVFDLTFDHNGDLKEIPDWDNLNKEEKETHINEILSFISRLETEKNELVHLYNYIRTEK